ncbi:hypothetical protein, partial [Necropsobacter massiliensis]|uniref:hypothetical protein n=1 Tax=Necropsobacter massiliensis TaxID=1400001 RepID=UPI001C581A32
CGFFMGDTRRQRQRQRQRQRRLVFINWNIQSKCLLHPPDKPKNPYQIIAPSGKSIKQPKNAPHFYST